VKLERSVERWSLCSPEAIAKGSEAQVTFCIKDAQHDIAALAGEIARLKAGQPRTQEEPSFCSCSEEVHSCSGDAA
jgi:hypothetical protein